jgi:hypothetical protein
MEMRAWVVAAIQQRVTAVIQLSAWVDALIQKVLNSTLGESTTVSFSNLKENLRATSSL